MSSESETDIDDDIFELACNYKLTGKYPKAGPAHSVQSWPIVGPKVGAPKPHQPHRVRRACKDCPQNKKRTIRRQAKSIILQNGEVWKERKMNGKTKVKSCEVCQRNSAKLAVGSTELHPIPVVTTWHHVSIDFVGPISPISTSGNRYILTLSDQFSKWVEAVAVPTKEAHRVASALYKIFMRMGLPNVLTTDNGSEFRNKLNAAMLKKLGIRYSFITPYHPQSNGLDERYNQTLQSMLSKAVMGHKEMWDEFIDSAVFAYNTSTHESTTYSPFEVMFGRKARLPVEADLRPIPSNYDSRLAHAPNTSNQMAQVAKERQEILKDVKHNILAAQAKQKQHYDAKHTRAKLFDVGVQSVHTQSLRSFLTPSLESVLIPTFQSAFAHSLQSVYATAFQSTSAHSLQSIYTTAFQSVYTTAFQSVYTTAFQSVYTTAFQSVYTTAFQSVYTTAFQSVYTQSTPQHSSQSTPQHSSQSTPQHSSQSTPQHSSQSTPQHSSQLSTINSSQSLPKSPHQSSSHLSKVISSTISSASGCPSNIIQVPLSCNDNKTECSGACVLHYKAAEDDEEFDETSLRLQEGEYALSKDITVCLWLEYRSLNGSTPLRDVSGGDFVIVNEELHGEFDEFRSKVYAYVDKEYSIVEAVELLQVWCRAKLQVKDNNLLQLNSEAASPQDPDGTDEVEDMQDTSAQNEDQQDSDEDFEDAYEWNVEGSDAVSSLENPEEDDELQVVDEIDIIEQELFPQEEGGCDP
eukprot:Em0006g809a